MSGIFLTVWILIFWGVTIEYKVTTVEASVPTFASPISSLTVAVGRDAVLKCVVDNLGIYRVAWIHVDKQVLLTLHTHVIIRSKRVGVSHHNFRTWFLHLKNVQPEDSGYYMCQINTQPMISQVGYLEIVVPPEFVNDHATRNISVMEYSNVSLSCRATGNPVPKIKWRREDGQEIRVGDELVTLYDGEELNMMKISRLGMGTYLCIASNGVPPAISRRMYIEVNFHPIIWIPNQLVGAAEGNDVTLECHSEAHPTATNFWIRNGNVIGTSNSRLEPSLASNGYKIHMKLLIKIIRKEDFGVYVCASKNALGESEGTVNLFKMKSPILPNRSTPSSSMTSPDEFDLSNDARASFSNKSAIADTSLQQQETELIVTSSNTGFSTTVKHYLLPHVVQVSVLFLLHYPW